MDGVPVRFQEDMASAFVATRAHCARAEEGHPTKALKKLEAWDHWDPLGSIGSMQKCGLIIFQDGIDYQGAC